MAFSYGSESNLGLPVVYHLSLSDIIRRVNKLAQGHHAQVRVAHQLKQFCRNVTSAALLVVFGHLDVVLLQIRGMAKCSP